MPDAADDLVRRYMDLFAHVRDDYSRQTPDGRYVRAREPLTPDVVRDHLRGRHTIGLYLLDAQDHVGVGVLDHDDKRVLPPATPGEPARIVPEDGLGLLQEARDRLARHGLASALEESRRGGHLWVFADHPVPAAEMRALLQLALGPEERARQAQGERAFELYPKGEHRGEGVGSAIRAPFGVHRKSGERYPFVDAWGHAVADTLAGQIAQVERVPRVDVERELGSRPWLAQQQPVREMGYDRIDQAVERGRFRTESPIREWVAAVDGRAIVESYGVRLDHQGVGRCPWPQNHAHGDASKSFQVGRNGRWRCYAEDIAGNAFDFVCRMENMDPKAALAYVQERWPVAALPAAPERAPAALPQRAVPFGRER